jgi:hypothetical protein
VVLPPRQAQALNPTPVQEEPTSEPDGIDFSGLGAPVEWPTYRNESLGYEIQYMPGWIVDGSGLTQTPKEVIFNPPDGEDFKVALSISLDERPLDVIKLVYAENQPEATYSEIEFAGEQAILYMYPWGRIEIYVPHQGNIYLISSDYGDQMDHLQSVGSFRFIN